MNLIDMTGFNFPAHMEKAEHVAQRRAPAVSSFERSYVPVSFVAKDWNVTPRRIRALLAAQRLQGRREANGYWEVAYPYQITIGTRGPDLKRQRKPKRGRPKLEEKTESLSKITLQEIGKS